MLGVATCYLGECVHVCVCVCVCVGGCVGVGVYVHSLEEINISEEGMVIGKMQCVSLL